MVLSYYLNFNKICCAHDWSPQPLFVLSFAVTKSKLVESEGLLETGFLKTVYLKKSTMYYLVNTEAYVVLTLVRSNQNDDSHCFLSGGFKKIKRVLSVPSIKQGKKFYLSAFIFNQLKRLEKIIEKTRRICQLKLIILLSLARGRQCNLSHPVKNIADKN